MAVSPQAILDACDQAVLDMAANKEPMSLTIAGRLITLATIEKIEKLRDYAHQLQYEADRDLEGAMTFGDVEL